jgi:hypothetical protein
MSFILTEALRRYNLNAVPSWSCLYGTHSMRGDGPETPEEVNRNTEWTSLIGDLWKIPHDNRINFCFRASTSDFANTVRVRNFVSHFHRLDSSDAPKGEYFNVWDWFDTGISTYWCPGKKTSEDGTFGSPLKSRNWSPEGESTSDSLYPLSTTIAPWRRMMYV